MKKSPFFIFLVIVGTLIGSAIVYIQSANFATMVKKFIVTHTHFQTDLGVQGDFSEFSIKLFPPGISINNPKVTVRGGNFVNLPPGSEVSAERIDLVFRPFQMFSGDIRVHEAVIVNGYVHLLLSQAFYSKKEPVKKKKLSFRWEDLLQIRADAVAVENTKLFVNSVDSDFALVAEAKYLKLEQLLGKEIGYKASFDLRDFKGNFPKSLAMPKLLEDFDRLKVSATITAQGIKVEEITMILQGLQASASGKVSGNILNPKSLFLDSNVAVNGQLEKFLRLASQKIDAEGDLSFSGHVLGKLDHLLETLRLEGSISGSEMRFKNWRADKLEIDGSWISSAKGGEIAVNKAVIERKERQRFGDSQPGDGGKITVGAFRTTLGSHDPVTVPIHFERAHVHWLGAPAVKDLYPMTFRLSGPLTATYLPAQKGKNGWEVQAKLGLRAEEFQLDNQRLGKTKPLHKVIGIPKINLDGVVSVDPTGVHPAGLTLELPHSKFRMGGKIDFKSGYDLRANCNVDLSDIGQIAENDIRGKGTLDVRVHGPTSRVFVDFDADLTDAYYLKLNLGSLKGRITWDDDPSHIVFTKVELARGKTFYTANGLVDVGKTDSVSLNFDVPQGDIRDFIKIFDNMTYGLWWFPHTLNGPVTGTIQVSGGLNTKELKVSSRMIGNNWEFADERFKTISLQGGYDRGKYYISEMKATKRLGHMQGRISFDDDQRFDWEFHTSDLTVSELDHIARLDVPFRGKINFSTKGQGKEGALTSLTQMGVHDFSVRGIPLQPSDLIMKTQGTVANVTGSALGGAGNLEVTYNFNPAFRSHLRCDLKNLDFTPVLYLLNSKLIQDPQVSGLISGNLDIGFTAGKIEYATGQAEFSEYALQKAGTSFTLSHPIAFKMVDGTFDLKSLEIHSNLGDATLELHGRESRLNGTVGGVLDLSAVEFFTSTVSKASGTANLDYIIGGTIKEPQISGQMQIDGATVKVASVDSAFENVSGSILLRQNILTVQKIESDLAGGRVQADGKITLYADRYPTVSLKAYLNENKIKVFPFQYVKIRGPITVRGDEPPYQVEGTINVLSAFSKEKILQRQTEGLKALKYTPPVSVRESGGASNFKLKIDVHADRGILVQNEFFDAELKAQVTVVNTLDAPRLLGTTDLVSGKMVFKDRTFQIQSANATFDSPTVLNPEFNLTATTEVNNVKVQLYVSGRLEKTWKVDLSSTPVMPEADILSLLTTGMTSTDFNKISSLDRSVVEQGEAASLLLHSLDFNREVQNKTGIQIQLDESINSYLGTSIFRPQSQTATTAAPRITIRKKIGKRLDLLGGSTVGVGSNSQKEVNAELHVTPGFSVIGVWENYEDVDAQDNRTSYGLDLKLQKKFK